MRFHFGVSFRWKTIKKFLLPILFGLLAYFGFGGIFSYFGFNLFKPYLLQVKAYYNEETTFNVDIPNYEERLKSRACNGVTFYDYIEYIINNVDFETSKYDLFITDISDVSNPSTFVNFYLHDKSSNTGVYDNDYTMWVRGDSSKKYSYSPRLWTMKTGYLSFGYVGSTCSSNIEPYTDPFTLSLINYIQNGSLINNVSQTEIGYIGTNSSTNLSVSETLTTMNNNTSYNVTKWWYYSSHKYVYYNQNYTNSSYYYKKVCLVNEDICYLPGDTYDSYRDLHYIPIPQPSYVGYQEDLKTFYTSLNPSNSSSYQLKVKFKVPQSLLGFYQDPTDYVANTSFDFACGGRVDNTNYYTYDSFNCSLTSSYVITNDYIEYTFSSLSLDHTLTGYDKLFVTIKTNYLDSNVSTTIYDYSYTYNLGSFFNTDYKGVIYENFSNLPLNFKVYFSSNNSLPNSKLYVSKYNFINYNIKYSGFSNTTNSQTSVIGSSILGNANINQPEFSNEFIETSVSNSIDTGILIYQDNSGIILPSLDLFFNGGMVVSFNNSSFDSFYYIDNNGDIVYGSFTPPIIEESTKYDISYYTSYVSNFINDLSSGSLVIASYTQEFYNSMPMVFQAFLLTMFILACIYFIYLAIKR